MVRARGIDFLPIADLQTHSSPHGLVDDPQIKEATGTGLPVSRRDKRICAERNSADQHTARRHSKRSQWLPSIAEGDNGAFRPLTFSLTHSEASH
jgi:hypothetical protein